MTYKYIYICANNYFLCFIIKTTNKNILTQDSGHRQDCKKIANQQIRNKNNEKKTKQQQQQANKLNIQKI